MGVNLVTIVRNFTITTETFPEDDHSVEHGCVKAGTHRLLRFDFLSHNIGDTDLELGDPKSRPDLFEFDPSHGHYHLKNFNTYELKNSSGSQVIPGVKQAFCLEDSEPHSPWAKPQARFTDCNLNQGISAGWADLYPYYLPCQFIVIDGVQDGDYTLTATTNAQKVVQEDTYEDNTTAVGIRISGNNVSVFNPSITA
jgi:hypothetical protein